MEETKELLISLSTLTKDIANTTTGFNINCSLKEYYNKLDHFNSYLAEIGQDKSLLSTEIVRNTINYYLNEISLFLLIALQHGLVHHTEIILNPEIYGSFLGEGFFINRCYALLEIKRESDFVTKFMDEVLPTIMKFLKSYEPTVYSKLMSHSTLDKFKFFHNACLSSVTTLINEARVSDCMHRNSYF